MFGLTFIAWMINIFIIYFLIAALFGYCEVRIRIFVNGLIKLKFN